MSDRASTDANNLRAAVSLIQDIWIGDPDPDMSAMISIAPPDAVQARSLELVGNFPALVLHKGSVLSSIMSAPMKVKEYAVALIGRRGIAPSQRAERIME